MGLSRTCIVAVALVSTCNSGSSFFTFGYSTTPRKHRFSPPQDNWSAAVPKPAQVVASVALVASLSFSSPVFADEIGVEKDAPTLFTGETVMVSKQMPRRF